MNIQEIDTLITTHGLSMVITIGVIYLLFKYFIKKLNSDNNSCESNFQQNFTEINTKLDNLRKEISGVQLSISNLKGLLSGIFFRNTGSEND